jgi:hypothetical protein
MALEHGCPIVPFGAVGIEDALDIAYDLRNSPVGRAAVRAGVRDDLLMPIVTGVGALPLPRPERLYFGFGEAIDPRSFGERGDDDDAAWALREATRVQVETLVAGLRETQASDPGRHLTNRVARRVKIALTDKIRRV